MRFRDFVHSLMSVIYSSLSFNAHLSLLVALKLLFFFHPVWCIWIRSYMDKKPAQIQADIEVGQWALEFLWYDHLMLKVLFLCFTCAIILKWTTWIRK